MLGNGSVPHNDLCFVSGVTLTWYMGVGVYCGQWFDPGIVSLCTAAVLPALTCGVTQAGCWIGLCGRCGPAGFCVRPELWG